MTAVTMRASERCFRCLSSRSIWFCEPIRASRRSAIWRARPSWPAAPNLVVRPLFVMAELIRTPYTEIMVAAILPAALSFTTAWGGVRRYAVRYDLSALPADAMPGWRAVMRSLPFFMVPFTILIGTIAFTSYTLAYAAVFATLATWLTLAVDEDGRISLEGW